MMLVRGTEGGNELLVLGPHAGTAEGVLLSCRWEQEALVLVDVLQELQRVEDLVIQRQIAWDCSSPSLPSGFKLMILAEKFGHVAKASHEAAQGGGSGADEKLLLRRALVALAAVAVAWAEALIEIEESAKK